MGRYILLAIVVGGALLLAIKQYRTHRAHQGASATNATPLKYDDDAYNTRAPDSVHIMVEVINATTVHGLGRKATTYLRDRGFDVVFVATTREQRKETLVLDRSNHPAWAQLVAKAMHGRSETRPDTTRYLDATVLVGSDWTPPPLPFYP